MATVSVQSMSDVSLRFMVTVSDAHHRSITRVSSVIANNGLPGHKVTLPHVTNHLLYNISLSLLHVTTDPARINHVLEQAACIAHFG